MLSKLDTTKYDESLKAFKKAFSAFVTKLTDKLNQLTTKTQYFNSTKLTLVDNTIHQYNGKNGVTKLEITFPKGNFVSTVLFSTAKSGTIDIKFKGDNVAYVGHSELRFFNSENWELNIQNGRIAGSVLFKSK